MAKEPTQCVPPTSANKDGVKEKKENTSAAKKRDPVLHNPLSSFRRKNDIINEIEESAKTLSLFLAWIPLLSFIGQMSMIKSWSPKRLWLMWSQ